MPAAFWYLAVFAPMIPDIDVVGFKLGISYGNCFGHRGATHSIAFALLLSVAFVFLLRSAEALKDTSSQYVAAAILFIAVAEHGFVDAMTDGGLGVAFFWPFSCKRYFFGFRPIHVSPLGAARFASRFSAIAGSELRWLIVPCLAILALDSLFRFTQARRLSSDGTAAG